MKIRFLRSNLWKGLLAVIFALVFMALTAGAASAQEPDPISECNLPENCTANDFGPINVHDVVIQQSGCFDHDDDPATPDAVLLDFKMTYTALGASRYDIGSLIALDGGLAMRDDLTGSVCYRDWLAPPLTTTDPDGVNNWPVTGSFFDGEENGDQCGDLPARDTATRIMDDVYVACVDEDNDGYLDMSVCLIYDNNAGADCYTLPDPTTGTTAKCECERVDIPVSPTAIEGLSFSVKNEALPTGLLLSALGLILVGAVLLSVYLRRRANA